MTRTKKKKQYYNTNHGKLTMENIHALLDRGITTNITKKTKIPPEKPRIKRPYRAQIPQDKLYFPRKLTGSKQWCET